MRKSAVKPARFAQKTYVPNGGGLFSNNQMKSSNVPVENNEILKVLSKTLTKKMKKGLDQENIRGHTPLVMAIKNHWFGMAKNLIKNGFYEENRVDKYTKLSPLHYAAGITDDDFLKFLIQTFPGHIDSKDMKKNTPLHYASHKRNKKFMELLLNAGANVNSKNDEGNTPLHFVCLSNNPQRDHSVKIEELLINAGADVNAANKKLETPLHLIFKT